MLGVSLVGLSGSLIRDAVREDTDVLTVLARALADLPGNEDTAPIPAPEPIEKPSATKVLIGVFFILFAQILCVSTFSHIIHFQFHTSASPLPKTIC
jgi:hypothetical protein